SALGTPVRETQFQVDPGDFTALAHEQVHQPTQNPPQKEQHPIGQLDDQPEQPQAKPHRPVAGVTQCSLEVGTSHRRTMQTDARRPFYPARRRQGKSLQEDQFRLRLAVNSCSLYNSAPPMRDRSLVTSISNLALPDSHPL